MTTLNAWLQTETLLGKAVDEILILLDDVESGRSRGSRGSYAADGVPTLRDVTIPVEMLRRLKEHWERREFLKAAIKQETPL